MRRIIKLWNTKHLHISPWINVGPSLKKIWVDAPVENAHRWLTEIIGLKISCSTWQPLTLSSSPASSGPLPRTGLRCAVNMSLGVASGWLAMPLINGQHKPCRPVAGHCVRDSIGSMRQLLLGFLQGCSQCLGCKILGLRVERWKRWAGGGGNESRIKGHPLPQIFKCKY